MAHYIRFHRSKCYESLVYWESHFRGVDRSDRRYRQTMPAYAGILILCFFLLRVSSAIGCILQQRIT